MSSVSMGWLTAADISIRLDSPSRDMFSWLNWCRCSGYSSSSRPVPGAATKPLNVPFPRCF